MAGRVPPRLKVLCLGNEILGDDAFAIRVAGRLNELSIEGVEVVTSEAFGADYLAVVDVIETEKAPPGTLYEFREDDISPLPGEFPHGIGLFQVLALGRKLGLEVPPEVVFLAVEPHDCLTVGGEMHPAVLAAVPKTVARIQELASVA
jgi:hydrogenase maturation protease